LNCEVVVGPKEPPPLEEAALRMRSAVPVPVTDGSNGAPDIPTWASAWTIWAAAQIYNLDIAVAACIRLGSSLE